MSVQYIGPVEVVIGNPAFSWSGPPAPRGIRAASISGMLTWEPAQQLSELVANFDEAVTISGYTGILESIYADDALLSPFNGWYLLQSFDMSPSQEHSLGSVSSAWVPFSLAAIYLGSYVPA